MTWDDWAQTEEQASSIGLSLNEFCVRRILGKSPRAQENRKTVEIDRKPIWTIDDDDD